MSKEGSKKDSQLTGPFPIRPLYENRGKRLYKPGTNIKSDPDTASKKALTSREQHLLQDLQHEAPELLGQSE